MDLLKHLREKFGTDLRNQFVKETEAKRLQVQEDALKAHEKERQNVMREFQYFDEKACEHLIEWILKEIGTKRSAIINKTDFKAKYTHVYEESYEERYSRCRVKIGTFFETFGRYSYPDGKFKGMLHLNADKCTESPWNNFDFKTGHTAVLYLCQQGFHVTETETQFVVTV
jgi:hypothetical protein